MRLTKWLYHVDTNLPEYSPTIKKLIIVLSVNAVMISVAIFIKTSPFLTTLLQVATLFIATASFFALFSIALQLVCTSATKDEIRIRNMADTMTPVEYPMETIVSFLSENPGSDVFVLARGKARKIMVEEERERRTDQLLRTRYFIDEKEYCSREAFEKSLQVLTVDTESGHALCVLQIDGNDASKGIPRY